MCGNIPPVHHVPSWCGALIKHTKNFSFTCTFYIKTNFREAPRRTFLSHGFLALLIGAIIIIIIIITLYSFTFKSCPFTGLGRPFGLQKAEAPRISKQSAHEGSKVISLKHRPPLPPRRYSFFYFDPLLSCGPTRAVGSSLLKFLDHTQRRTTFGRTPLDE